MTTQFTDVVRAWQTADPDKIHPLRAKQVDDYWSSGVSQASDAAEYIPEGGRVLDFGCGEGRLAIPLAMFGYEVIAADSSPKMLARTEKNLIERSPAGTSIELLLTDGIDLRLKNNRKVDVVIARAVLIHHSHKDVERLVKSLSGVLKKGGHLIADWPRGSSYERRDWIDVTTWEPEHRLRVAEAAGLTLIDEGQPSVWKKL